MRIVYVIARDNKEEITIPSKESVYYSPYPAFFSRQAAQKYIEALGFDESHNLVIAELFLGE
jgi:hypothetical protein